MPAIEFRDDDQGFFDWRSEHPDGYVINIQRSYNTSTPLHSRARSLTCCRRDANIAIWR